MAPIVLTVEARLKRTGIEKWMVLGNGLEAATADPSLLRLIARAHGIGERLFHDTTLSLKEIAKEEDVVGSYVTRLLRLSFLGGGGLTKALQPNAQKTTHLKAQNHHYPYKSVTFPPHGLDYAASHAIFPRPRFVLSFSTLGWGHRGDFG